MHHTTRTVLKFPGKNIRRSIDGAVIGLMLVRNHISAICSDGSLTPGRSRVVART